MKMSDLKGKKKLNRLKMPGHGSNLLAIELGNEDDDGYDKDHGMDLGMEDSGADHDDEEDHSLELGDDEMAGQGDIGDHGMKSDEEDMEESQKPDDDEYVSDANEGKETPEEEKKELEALPDDVLLAEIKRRGLMSELMKHGGDEEPEEHEDDQSMYS